LLAQDPAPQPPSLTGFFFLVLTLAGAAGAGAAAGAGVGSAAGAGIAAAGAGASAVAAAGVLAVDSAGIDAAAAAGGGVAAEGVAGAGVEAPPQAATPNAAAAIPKIFVRSVISMSELSLFPPAKWCGADPRDTRVKDSTSHRRRRFCPKARKARRSCRRSTETGLDWASVDPNMRITVLYFSAVRELVGQGEEALDLPEDVRTVADLASYVVKLHPPLAGRLTQVRWAKNEEFVMLAAELAEGDVLAVLPPVAGG
jgi:molybdopterin synthase sulfur carrier subunit